MKQLKEILILIAIAFGLKYYLTDKEPEIVSKKAKTESFEEESEKVYKNITFREPIIKIDYKFDVPGSENVTNSNFFTANGWEVIQMGAAVFLCSDRERKHYFFAEEHGLYEISGFTNQKGVKSIVNTGETKTIKGRSCSVREIEIENSDERLEICNDSNESFSINNELASFCEESIWWNIKDDLGEQAAKYIYTQTPLSYTIKNKRGEIGFVFNNLDEGRLSDLPKTLSKGRFLLKGACTLDVESFACE